MVTAIKAPYVQVQYLYFPKKAPFLCRPVLFGLKSGFHWMPKKGSRLWVGYVEGSLPVALCGLSFFDPTNPLSLSNQLPALDEDECVIVGPTGSILKWVKTGAVQMTILDALGAMGTEQLTINGGARKIVADGDTITGTISAPSGGGSCTFSLHVVATNSDVLVR